MRRYRRYSPIFVVLGIAAGLLAGALRLIQGEVTPYVQTAIAVALVLLAGYLALEAEAIQKWAGGRQARFGANAVATTLAFVGIVGIVNYLSSSKYHKDWDLTENKQNTLAQQTIDVLNDLPAPVHATAFISGQYESYRDSTKRLLQNYVDHSNGKFTFEIVDPFLKPQLAAQMDVTKDATVVFMMDERREEASFGDEQEFTSALIRLAHPEKRTVYFSVGHGEHDTADTGDNGFSRIKAGLERQNYSIQTLNLVVTDTIPSDAAAVIIGGPQVGLTVTETLALGKYLDDGGGVILMIDPVVQQKQTAEGTTDALVDWLAKNWGIQIHNDLVIDPASSQASDPFTPFVYQYGNHDITDKLISQTLYSFYPLARSIDVGPVDAASGRQAQPLVLTSPSSWGETDFESLNSGAKSDAADRPGPLNIAVTAEDTLNRGRLVVFGDSDFAINALAERYGNGDILYNSVNWVTGNIDLISIPPKDSTFRPPLDLSTRTIALFGLTSVCLLPFGVLLIGVVVVWNRRTRYK